MDNINDIMALMSSMREDDGMTLKGGKVITYDAGFQIAKNGYVCSSLEEAASYIEEMNGDCGVWYHGGDYYVDYSYYFNFSEKICKEIAKRWKQLSVFDWKTKKCVYVK